MELENAVSPVEETQNPSAEPVAENPEVATPEADETEQADSQNEADPREKAVKSLTRRVDRLTAARYQAQAEADMARRQLAEMQQRLSQYEQPQEQQQPQVDVLSVARQLKDFDAFNERSNTLVADGQKRFQEFGKALQIVSEEAGPLVVPVAPGSPYARPTPVGEAVLAADDPAAVLHYLGQNPDLASQLHGKSAAQAARLVARIEADLSKPKEPKASAAPRPISPTKNASRDTGGLSDELPLDEWMRRRNTIK